MQVLGVWKSILYPFLHMKLVLISDMLLHPAVIAIAIVPCRYAQFTFWVYLSECENTIKISRMLHANTLFYLMFLGFYTDTCPPDKTCVAASCSSPTWSQSVGKGDWPEAYSRDENDVSSISGNFRIIFFPASPLHPNCTAHPSIFDVPVSSFPMGAMQTVH